MDLETIITVDYIILKRSAEEPVSGWHCIIMVWDAHDASVQCTGERISFFFIVRRLCLSMSFSFILSANKYFLQKVSKRRFRFSILTKMGT